MSLISVVIPCRNEKNNIRACVESIFNSTYKNVEVIVVDGMSDDGTRDVLEELKAEYTGFQYIDNSEQLTPFAFNLGVHASSGDYVQIVGSRNVLDANYLEVMKRELDENKSVACVGGDYKHTYQSDWGRFISLAMEMKWGVGGSNYRTKNEKSFVDTVGVPMYRKNIFDEIGYFDENLTRNQDDDFNFRVTQAGYKIVYQPEGKTLYYVRDNLKKLFKQFMQYGYFKVFVNKKHRSVTTLRQLAPICFLLYLSLGFVGCLLRPQHSLTYIIGLGLYFILTWKEASKFTKLVPEVLKIQFAVFIMHIGYGWGYLRGIIDFLLLNKNPSSNMKRQTT